MRRADRATALVERLAAVYPDAHCELDFGTPFQLLVATVLSAQCTDKRVNLTTPELFRRYPDARSLAAASQHEVEQIIRPTGFFRNKAKNLIAAASAIEGRHHGQVPDTLAELAALPGVGRKTANVVLGNAFGINQGVVVDTHVARLSQRLGLSRHSQPARIERDLMKVVPRPSWCVFSHWLIWHGRRRCKARRPDCAHCELAALCPSRERILRDRAATKPGSAASRPTTGSS